MTSPLSLFHERQRRKKRTPDEHVDEIKRTQIVGIFLLKTIKSGNYQHFISSLRLRYTLWRAYLSITFHVCVREESRPSRTVDVTVVYEMDAQAQARVGL